MPRRCRDSSTELLNPSGFGSRARRWSTLAPNPGIRAAAASQKSAEFLLKATFFAVPRKGALARASLAAPSGGRKSSRSFLQMALGSRAAGCGQMNENHVDPSVKISPIDVKNT